MSDALAIPRDVRGRTRAEVIEQARQAQGREVEGLQAGMAAWGGDRPIKFTSATSLETPDGGYGALLTLETPAHPPEMSGVEVRVDGATIRGSVEAVDRAGAVLRVTLARPLPPDASGTVSFDVTRLGRALMKRLQLLAESAPDAHPRPVLDAWLGLGEPVWGDRPPAHPATARLNDDQRAAVARALGSPATFVFGPPGTGKTHTLGALVAEWAQRQGLRVLVTAHTNTAVDTALRAVVGAVSSGWRSGRPVARFGAEGFEMLTPGVGSADRRGNLRADDEAQAAEDRRLDRMVEAVESAAADRLHSQPGDSLPVGASWRERLARIRDLLRRAWEGHTPETLGAADVQLRELVLAAETAVMADATRYAQRVPIVGATLSWLALYGDRVGPVDAVVLDEAGMVLLPQGVFAGSLAARHVAAFGDPAQLPPVAQAPDAETLETLRRHPYAQAGLEQPDEPDPRRPLLGMQYRMRPAIRALVSRLFYADLLTDAPERAQHAPEHALTLLDTSRAGARAEQVGSSRRNLVHARLVTALVRHLVRPGGPAAPAPEPPGTIAVITPFKAQAREIRTGLRAAGLGEVASVHTVHRVQGGEYDTVVLDLTDTPPRLGMFLNESLNPDLPNLLCVALSRAREHLYVLAADREFRRLAGDEDPLILRLLDRVRAEGQTVDITTPELPLHEGVLLGEMGARAPSVWGDDEYGGGAEVWSEPA